MKARSAVLVLAVAVAVLVIPATGQAKVPPFYWTQVLGGGPPITSYDYGFVEQYSATWLRLGGTGLPKSGKLKVTLKGSPAFFIVENRCKAKIIGGPLLSCWVEVAWEGRWPPVSSRAWTRPTTGTRIRPGVTRSGNASANSTGGKSAPCPGPKPAG